jgi:hypothetical protein
MRKDKMRERAKDFTIFIFYIEKESSNNHDAPKSKKRSNRKKGTPTNFRI